MGFLTDLYFRLFSGQLKVSAYMNFGLLTVHGKLLFL